MSDKVRKLSVLNITLLSLIIALACVAIIVIVQVYGGDPANRKMVPPQQQTAPAESPGGTMADAVKDMYENPPDLFEDPREQIEACLVEDYEDRVIWQCRVGELTDKLATVNAEGIYLATEGRMLYALSPEGKPRWTKTYEDSPVRRPVLDTGGNVFCCVKGTVYSYDPAGNLRWEYKTPGTVAAAPAVDSSGNLVVKVRPFREGESYIIAVNPEGGERWRYEMEYDLEGYPLVAGTKDRVYDMGKGGVFQTFTRAGTRGWGLGLSDRAMGPAVDGRGMIYVAANPYDDRPEACVLLCMEPKSGWEVWSVELPGYAKRGPFVNDANRVYVLCQPPQGNHLYSLPVLAFDQPDGKDKVPVKLWETGLYDAQILVCSPHDGDPLAVNTNEGTIFLDSSTGEPFLSLSSAAGHPVPVAVRGDRAYCHADGILTAVDISIPD